MASLVELVGASVKLTRRGGALWAACPFHAPDKTGSFKVEHRYGKERFYCFGCGAKGDAADWIMLTRKVDYPEACRILGLGGPVKPDPAIIEARRQEAWRRRVLTIYRHRNPDCVCPDWLIETPAVPQWFKVRREVEPRRYTAEEFDRIWQASQRETGGE